MNKKISIYSFFSGSGFLDLGFEEKGFNICFVNEFYKPFLEAYKFSRKTMKAKQPEYGYSNDDISEYLNGKKLAYLKDSIKKQKKRNITGFIGGPPCPDFSVGGKNKGSSGQNGKLSGVYIDLISKCNPDFFLFENVRGLWRTQKHRAFFDTLKQKMHRSDYVTTEKLINAIEYGAPQDRDRIILIGFKKELLNDLEIKTDSRKDLGEAFSWKIAKQYARENIFNLSWPQVSKFKEDSNLPSPQDIPLELTVQYWFEKNNVEKHPNSRHCFRPQAGMKRFAEVLEGDDSKKSFKRLHRWRYSPTACYGNNEVHLHPYKLRRINVAEAMAIQSLPSSFILPDEMTLTDMFKTVGNGVPYLAAKGLASSINAFLEKKSK